MKLARLFGNEKRVKFEILEIDARSTRLELVVCTKNIFTTEHIISTLPIFFTLYIRKRERERERRNEMIQRERDINAPGPLSAYYILLDSVIMAITIDSIQ